MNSPNQISKGVVMLNAIKAKRKLKEVCTQLDINYKFAHHVTEGIKPPSFDLMNKFSLLIPGQYWFEDADKNFIEEVRKSLTE